MRVLQLLHNYPPEFRGGVERAVENLVGHLHAMGITSTVLCGSEHAGGAPALTEAKHEGTRVLRVAGGMVPRQPVDPHRSDLAPLIDRVLSLERPDVVHVHHWWNLGVDLVRRAAAHGIPSVVTLHDHFASCARFFRLPEGTPCEAKQGIDACGPCLAPMNPFDEKELHARLQRRQPEFLAELETARAVCAPSISHARRLQSAFPEIEVTVVPLGSQEIKSVAPPSATGTLTVLHAGNLCRIKGVEVLVRAVRAARERGASIRLLLAGPTVESGLDLEGAELVGPYDAAALAAWAAQADVMALPSLALESYSYALDEALRLGLPVLVSDRGALSERIGARGRVVPAGDTEAWAKTLVELAADRTALDVARAAPLPRLATPAESAATYASIYGRVRKERPPTPNMEAPVLARLEHLEGRLGEVLALMHRLSGKPSP